MGTKPLKGPGGGATLHCENFYSTTAAVAPNKREETKLGVVSRSPGSCKMIVVRHGTSQPSPSPIDASSAVNLTFSEAPNENEALFAIPRGDKALDLAESFVRRRRSPGEAAKKWKRFRFIEQWNCPQGNKLKLRFG